MPVCIKQSIMPQFHVYSMRNLEEKIQKPNFTPKCCFIIPMYKREVPVKISVLFSTFCHIRPFVIRLEGHDILSKHEAYVIEVLY